MYYPNGTFLRIKESTINDYTIATGIIQDMMYNYS